MTDRSALRKVAIFGHVGKGNLGDEATVAAVIHNVRLRHPEAEICAFTLNPADTQQRHKIPAFPVRRLSNTSSAAGGPQSAAADGKATGPGLVVRIKQGIKKIPVLRTLLRGLWKTVLLVPACAAGLAFLVKSSRRLKGTDLFIVSGGGQLGDYFGGAWGFPFTILKWSVLAKARGAKLAFLSVGAGPLQTFLGKRFLRWALRLADYRSFRDESSKQLVESLGVSGENHVFPDLVHGLPVPAGAGAGAGRHGAWVVGINPLPFHDSRYWAEDTPAVYQEYVGKLASFAVRLIEAGHRVVLFPTQVIADPPVIQDVAALVRHRLPAACGDSLTCPPVASFDDLYDTIAQTDVVVAGRFHGIILSFLMGRPVIGLSYYRKTEELMVEMGQREFVADIGTFDVPWLLSRFEQIQAGAAAIRHRIESARSEYRAALESQYGLLLKETTLPEPQLAPQTA